MILESKVAQHGGRPAGVTASVLLYTLSCTTCRLAGRCQRKCSAVYIELHNMAGGIQNLRQGQFASQTVIDPATSRIGRWSAIRSS